MSKGYGNTKSRRKQRLLSFSRKQILQPLPLSLNSVVRECEGMFRRVIGEKIEPATDLADDLGAVMADHEKISQTNPDS